MEDAHYCQTDREDAVGVSTYDGGADDGTKSYRQTYTAALMFSLSISFFFFFKQGSPFLLQIHCYLIFVLLLKKNKPT